MSKAQEGFHHGVVSFRMTYSFPIVADLYKEGKRYGEIYTSKYFIILFKEFRSPTTHIAGSIVLILLTGDLYTMYGVVINYFTVFDLYLLHVSVSLILISLLISSFCRFGIYVPVIVFFTIPNRTPCVSAGVKISTFINIYFYIITYFFISQGANGSIMSGLDLFDNEIPQDEEQRYIVDALTDRALKS